MKRFATYFLLGCSAFLMACNDNDVKDDNIDNNFQEEDNNENNENPTPPEETVVNLSEKEMANCYIVQSAGKYKFKADNQFNLGEGLPVPPTISPKKANLLWQTTSGSISSVELIYEDDVPYVEFEVIKAEGNALISVANSNGETEWSWHIWMPLQDVEGVISDNGDEVMNMNLGALTNTPGDAASYGMLYQWGRKDPFPASESLTGTTTTVSAPMYDIEGNNVTIDYSDWTNVDNNTIQYSISHPTICLSNYGHFPANRDWLKGSETDDTLWGNPEGYLKDEENNYVNKGVKTCYDPSPAGWRIPSADVFSHFTTSGGYAWDFVDFNIADINKDNVLDLEDYNYGWHFYINATTPLYFPAASRFDGSYAMLMGSMSGLWGNYWSNAPSPSSMGAEGMAISALAFQVKDMGGNEMVTMSPAGIGSKADAYSIRCVRE